MTPSKALAFDRRRGEIERLLSSGEPFAVLEETIERSELARDEKAALWLLAWSSQPAAELRENLRATLALFGSDREVGRRGTRDEGHPGTAGGRRLSTRLLRRSSSTTTPTCSSGSGLSVGW